MLVSTCIAILAVDFHIFPRRFAKTETFGTGLMDMGVGAFVFGRGLVSRGKAPSLLSSVPMIVLGFVRLAMVKGGEYQEHASEYGVHWNFFFTMAAVSLLQRLSCISPHQTAPAAGILLLGYETALHLGLQEWILHAPRDNLVSQNKEGIASCMGYLVILLVGSALGSHIQQRGGMQQLRLILGVSLVSWLLWGVGEAALEHTSRRMVNATYVFWTIAFNTLLLFVFGCLSLFVSQEAQTRSIAQSINSQGLLCFLAGNVATGAVNVTIRTLDQGPMTSFCILVVYMAIVSGGIVVRDIAVFRIGPKEPKGNE